MVSGAPKANAVSARPPRCRFRFRSRWQAKLALAAALLSPGLRPSSAAQAQAESGVGEVAPRTSEGRTEAYESQASLEARRQRADPEGDSARDLLRRGAILYRQDRYEEALAELRKSFTLNEKDPEVSKALGLCLVKLGREDLAETFFEIAIRLAPTDAQARYYLGLNRYTTKRFEAATAAFAEAVALRPGWVLGRSYLGRAHEALGNLEAADRHYRRAHALNLQSQRRSADPPLLLGSMLYRQGRLDDAERYLAEAVGYAPDSALAHYRLGLLLERVAQTEDAIEALKRAASLAPEDHRPHYALARIFRRVGDERAAAAAVRRFRELRVRSESETH